MLSFLLVFFKAIKREARTHVAWDGERVLWFGLVWKKDEDEDDDDSKA